jgi:carbonic anhydrase/acetyltransferase-like protein (isoleucine patch superfamily)
MELPAQPGAADINRAERIDSAGAATRPGRAIRPRGAACTDSFAALKSPARGSVRIFALDRVAPAVACGAFLADGACVIGDVTLAERSSVWFCAVLRGDNGSLRIGERSNVQDGALIHCLPGGRVDVGSQVSIGHQAAIHGATIGDRCLIGMQAIVMDGAIIASDTLVAAGSVVPPGRRFAPGMLVRGRPARAVRALTDRELDHIQANALEYVARAERFARTLRRL